MSRVPLADRRDFGPEEQQVFDRLESRPQPVGDAYYLTAHSPLIGNALLDVSEQIRASKVLSPTLRELAILRTTQLIGAEYQFNHHWNYALKLGIERSKLEALGDDQASDRFTPLEKAIIRLADELAQPPFKVSEVTWRVLQAGLPLRAITELVIVAGWYHLSARITGAFETDLEPWYQRE